MFITGLGTAAPRWRYTQGEIHAALLQSPLTASLTSRSRLLLKKVLLGSNGIETRALALDRLDEAFQMDADVLHQRFARHAPTLAVAAAEEALSTAEVAAREIDAVVVSSCTGYLCPGLTSYVIERLGLRCDTLPLDLVGQGCGAALPNLATGEALIESGRARHVLSICVEVCSAAFYLDDDPGVLISNCLFGDGAGAAVLSSQAGGGRAVRWATSGSLTSPQDRDLLRFETKGGLLRNILTLQVPTLAATAAEKVLRDTLAKAGLAPETIAGWIWHAGGRDVLVALQQRLNLPEPAFRHSYSVLREFGNISSASVYHVLKRALAADDPGGWWWLSAFGAGFSCHGALLEVDPL